MIKLSNLKATRVIDKGFIEITFAIEDTSENLSNYQFDLLRANASNGNFKVIHTNILNLKCIDYSANLFNHEIKYFYKIRIRNIKERLHQDTDYFTPFTVDEDEYSFTISHIYNTYLDVAISNSDFLLSKRMKTGQLCDCYDDVRNSSYEGECLNCFGTNFKGGFYPAISFKLCFFNSPSYQEEMAPSGTFESQSPLQAWTSNYPVIQEGDIVTDTRTNTKFTVVNWQPSHKNGMLIRQTFQIAKLPESSILNKIPLK